METCLQLISSEVVSIQMIHITQMSLQTFKHFLDKQDEAKHCSHYKHERMSLMALALEITNLIQYWHERCFWFSQEAHYKGALNVFKE